LIRQCLGPFPREFTDGTGQLQDADRDFLVALVALTPPLASAEVLTFVNVNSIANQIHENES